MKLGMLIKALQQAKKKYGNAKVLISADPEGNDYADLGDTLNVDPSMGDTILIFPTKNVRPEDL